MIWCSEASEHDPKKYIIVDILGKGNVVDLFLTKKLTLTLILIRIDCKRIQRDREAKSAVKRTDPIKASGIMAG